MKRTAMLVIDVQNDMFSAENPVFNSEKLVRNINHLLVNARKKQIPIIYIQHNEPEGRSLEHGTEGWEIYSGVAPKEGDLTIQKTTPDSFYQTNLQEELKKKNIEHLVLIGIQTEICVDTTCRRAFSSGYDVTLVADAHSTWSSPELSALQIINHHNRALRWFADIQTTESITF